MVYKSLTGLGLKGLQGVGAVLKCNRAFRSALNPKPVNPKRSGLDLGSCQVMQGP